MSENSTKSRSLSRPSKPLLKSPSAGNTLSLPMSKVHDSPSTTSFHNQSTPTRRNDNVKSWKGTPDDSTSKERDSGKLGATNASRFSLKTNPSRIEQPPFIAETKEDNDEKRKSRASSFSSAKSFAGSLTEEKDIFLPPPQVKISVSATSDHQIDNSFKKRLRFSSFNKHELELLEKRFKKLDNNNSGTLSVDEFMRIPQLQKNPLVSRIIKIFDSSHDGLIDFREFVHAMSLWSLATDRAAKLKFAFKMYDVDGDGYISNGELFQVLHLMVGDNLEATELQQIVDKAIIYGDKDNDGKISFPEFCSMLGEVECDQKQVLN